MRRLREALCRRRRWWIGGLLLVCCSGCPRNTTTLDDRTLENRPHVETEHPVNREDPWRP